MTNLVIRNPIVIDNHWDLFFNWLQDFGHFFIFVLIYLAICIAVYLIIIALIK